MLKTTAITIQKKTRSHPVLNEFVRIITIIIGASLVAAGLELFLVPNNFLDGGVTGVSIILSNFFPSIPLGVFIALLNIPFLIFAYIHGGLKPAIRITIGVGALSLFTVILHHVPAATDEFVLALGYGGALLGIGVGLALRSGGALDGTEAFSAVIADKTRFSVDQLILVINFLIFGIAAFVFSPEEAMASFLLFYVIVAPIIKRFSGDDETETRSMQVFTTTPDTLTELLNKKFHKRVIQTEAHRVSPHSEGKPPTPVTSLTTIIARTDETLIVDAIHDIDPDALVIFNSASNVHGFKLVDIRHR